MRELLSRRQALTLGAAAAGLAAAPAWAAPAQGPSLARLARDKGLSFGSAVGAGPAGSLTGGFEDAAYRQVLIDECGLLVPENELKWYVLRPDASSKFAFARADRIAAFAKANGQALRGHTLLWHHPKWFPAWTQTHDFGPKPAQAVARMMTDHINTVCARYPQMISWDVVNETVDEKTGALRGTVFSDAMGPEPLLDLCYHTARAAAPKARLTYNDYMGWEADNAAHRTGVLKLLEGFRKRGVPVDDLGVQSHIHVGSKIGPAEEKAWVAFLDEVTGLGYGLMLTEFDVNDGGVPAGTSQSVRDAEVAAYGQGYLDLMLSYSQVSEVLAWGMVDKYSWLTGQWLSAAKRGQRPLPYDNDYQPKPLRQAIAAALKAAPAR